MSKKKVFDILEECSHSLKNVKKKQEKPNGKNIIYKPFFHSFIIKDYETHILDVLNGGVVQYKTPISKPHSLEGRIEMRMGHPEKGSSAEWETFQIGRNLEKDAAKQAILEGCKDVFWNSAEDLEIRYNEILGGLYDKQEKYLFFSKEKPNKYIQREVNLEVNLDLLEKNFKEIHKKVHEHIKRSNGPKIKDIEFFMESTKEKVYYLNSEGSKIYTNRIVNKIVMEAYAIDEKNREISHLFRWYGNDKTNLPDKKTLLKESIRIVNELGDILKSPIQKNGSFPTIFCPENSGVLAHEVVGHALEGHRLQEDDEEVTSYVFRDQVGKKFAPDFIDLYDDPTLEYFNGIALNGAYPFDEDGVKSKKIELIKNGILKDYLHSRQSAGYAKTNSNGHCRSDEVEDEPCPRMGNIILKSHNEVPFEKLKENLIKECKKQGKEYGLYFQETSGGLTLPEESFYNTLPTNIFRIYANGKVERVRGIYVVGTPIQTLENIIQTSDNYQIFNGWCGAESGYVLSSEIAPDTLVKNLEINTLPDSHYNKEYEEIFNKKKK